MPLLQVLMPGCDKMKRVSRRQFIENACAAAAAFGLPARVWGAADSLKKPDLVIGRSALRWKKNSFNGEDERMNRMLMTLACGLGLALTGLAADVVPTAYVSDTGRTITADGKRVELDAAHCFDAWPGGVKPSSETERQAVYEQWGAYANWNADFVVSFDRMIAAESVSLYGQTSAFGTEWIPLPIAKSLAANEPHRLLEEGLGRAVPYVAIAEEIVRFMCGVKNLSPANVGTTMTIELRLSDPNSSATRTLARRTCTFRKVKKPNWFDAEIADYESWPADAAKAVGGEWQSKDEPLDEAAEVTTAGLLSVDATALEFVASRPRTLDESSGSVKVTSDIDFGVNELGALPKVDSKWKGGVIRVKEAEGEAYYGLAKEGGANVWKRLEGPAPTDGTVRFEMTVGCTAGQPVATYTVNGAAYRLNGMTSIPVVASGDVKGVSLGGEGTLASLFAAIEKGFALMIK